MPKKNTQVRGHSLWYEGAPFSEKGVLGGRTYLGSISTAGVGHAKCECGALSTQLQSGRDRRAWHSMHKAEVVARQNEFEKNVLDSFPDSAKTAYLKYAASFK